MEYSTHHLFDFFMGPDTVTAPDVHARNAIAVLVHEGLMVVALNEVGAVEKRRHCRAMTVKVLVEIFQDDRVHEDGEYVGEGDNKLGGEGVTL